MNRLLALALLSCVALAGCGGSNDPATEAESNDPPVATPGPLALTLSGIVTDAPVVAATVAVSVAGERFEATQPTDAEGAYTIDIESEDAGALVHFEAVDATGTVRLSLLASDFAGLTEQAAAGVVANVDITNITTALYTLVQAQSSDIATAAELDDAIAQVDPAALLELAAAIKLVVEGIGGVTLPAGVADTQALADAIAGGSSSFLDDVELASPGALDQAIELLLTDGHATPAFDADSAAGVYAARDGSLLLALLADGSGTVQSGSDAGFDLSSWWVDGAGRLVLAHDGEGMVRDELTQLSHAGDSVSVVLQNAELAERGPRAPVAFEHLAFVGAFATGTAAGSYEYLSNPGHYAVLLEDGSGYEIDAESGAHGDSFDWSVADDGSLGLSLTGGAQTRITRVRRGDDGALRVLIVRRDTAGALTGVEVDALRYSEEIVDAPVAGTETRAKLAGATFGVFEAAARLLTFSADGTLVDLSQGDAATEANGSWSVDGDGRIVLERDGGSETFTLLASVGDESLSVERDGDGVSSTWQRVAHADFETMIGSHALFAAEGAALGETIELGFDGSGQRSAGDAPAEACTWEIDAAGRVVLDFGGGAEETLNLIVGADASGAPAVRVRRANGTLERVDAVRLLNQG